MVLEWENSLSRVSVDVRPFQDGLLDAKWSQQPDGQQVMTGQEALNIFGKFAQEACEANPSAALQLQKMVKNSAEVKLVVSRGQPADINLQEWCIDALCSDHTIRVIRRVASDPQSGTP